MALRQAGGPGGRGAFRLTWRGGTVARAISDAVERGCQTHASVLRQRFRSEFHRVTGDMAEKSFAVVEVVGGRKVVRGGSTSDHTAYHELGTARYSGHPQIRQIMDEENPRLGSRIADEMKHGT